MSEVKLHKVSVGADVNNIPDGWFRIIPATTAEIMEAHPRCKDCKHYGPNIPSAYKECTHSQSPFYNAMALSMYDYCRHWEGKE